MSLFQPFRQVLFLFVCLLLFSQAGLAQDKPTTVPLKKVVLFNSGVGFFEHTAEIEGNAHVDLKFNVDDVNDLLKSMVLQDLGGGRISTVNYGSKDPITKTLRTFAIDLTSNPTLADLLAQIRGEKVQIDAPSQITGTILGLEKRRQKVGENDIIEVDILNLLTDEGLRSVPLSGVGRIKLVNDKLDAELRQALMILAMGHATDKKTVTLNFLGQGKRPVRVGYVQEAPIWKTSYRLVLNEGENPFLQGWAIVENTTEEDWNDVALTLVSGRPISFIMDLYQPLYVNRPVVEPELFASLRPQRYDQDLSAREQEFRKLAQMDAAKQVDGLANARRAGVPAAPPAPEAAGRGLAGGIGGAGFGAADKKAERLNLQQGVQSVAQAADVGELFQYVIDNPVKLPHQQSAMLPIVNGSVAGTKVSIYNASVHAKHPLNGLELKNSTGLHLMQGPITVFDSGAYAGDAQIQDLPPDSERLISYAMDLDTEVAPETKSSPEQLVSVSIVKGVLSTSRKYQRTQQYTIKNSGKKAKTVLIEYPLDTTWTLVSPTKPEPKKTRDMYRFTVNAEPGKPALLAIEEQRTVGQQIALTNLDDNSIRIYLSARVVSEQVKAALSEVVKRKLAIQDQVVQRERLEAQIKVIDAEQARIRQNMAQLDRNTDLYNRYVKKFGEQEDQVEAMRKEIVRLQGEEAKLRKLLDDYLVGLNLT